MQRCCELLFVELFRKTLRTRDPQFRGIEWSMRKWCLSENISSVFKSRHSKQESWNLGLTTCWTVPKSWTFIIWSRIFKQGSRKVSDLPYHTPHFYSLFLLNHAAVAWNTCETEYWVWGWLQIPINRALTERGWLQILLHQAPTERVT